MGYQEAAVHGVKVKIILQPEGVNRSSTGKPFAVRGSQRTRRSGHSSAWRSPLTPLSAQERFLFSLGLADSRLGDENCECSDCLQNRQSARRIFSCGRFVPVGAGPQPMSGKTGHTSSSVCETVAAVRLNGIHKTYGTVHALRGLDVTLGAGEIHAFLGSNGAGKTTAISIMTGLRRADSGSVEVLGADPRDATVRRRIGLTPQESGFPNNLRVSEVIRLVRAHYPTPLSDNDLFASFPLQSVWQRQTGGLSGGQRRSLAVALAFVGNPDLVFLDEPTTGLDVTARQALWQAVRGYRNAGGTIVLTTHYLEEAEALASRVIVLCEWAISGAGDDGRNPRPGRAKPH